MGACQRLQIYTDFAKTLRKTEKILRFNLMKTSSS